MRGARRWDDGEESERFFELMAEAGLCGRVWGGEHSGTVVRGMTEFSSWLRTSAFYWHRMIRAIYLKVSNSEVIRVEGKARGLVLGRRWCDRPIQDWDLHGFQYIWTVVSSSSSFPFFVICSPGMLDSFLDPLRGRWFPFMAARTGYFDARSAVRVYTSFL